MILNKIRNRDFGYIPLDLIDLSNENVRKEGALKNIEELKTSIKQIGLIHPITIFKKEDGRYELLVGQRRFIAYQQLNEKEIPAIIITNKLDDLSKKVISFVENIHRKALPYSDTIRVCDELFNEEKGSDNQKIENVAKKIGISPQTVAKYLSYRLVPKKVQNMVEEGKLTRSQAFRITTAFWPTVEKIEKIAEYTTKVPKPEWERALNIGRKDKKMSFEEIVSSANKVPTEIRVSVPISKEILNLLNDKAQKISKTIKREITIEELILDMIDKFLDED